MATVLDTTRRRLAALACAFLASWMAPAVAGSFVDGEFETYDQNIWGADPADGPPASLLAARFFDVFTAGSFFGSTLPGAFEMDFGGADAMATFLPQGGPPAGLDGDISNPTSTSAGVFGGQVVALGLNIDFADAHFLAHPAGLSFGDLVVKGYSGTLAGLDGRTVRQVNEIVNAALGGLFEPFAIADLSQVIGQLNSSFEGGYVSAYAEAYLDLPAVAAPVPEPSTWLLMLVSMSGFGAAIASRRSRSAGR